jgi:hypothetical protein
VWSQLQWADSGNSLRNDARFVTASRGTAPALLTIAVIAKGMTITAENTIVAVITASTVRRVRWRLRRQMFASASDRSDEITQGIEQFARQLLADEEAIDFEPK